MKFSINRSELLNAIGKTGDVSGRVQMPALNGVRLTVENDSLDIAWTNLEETILTKVEVRNAVSGAVLVPKKELVRMLKVLPAGNVDFKAVGDRVSIKGVSGRFKFDSMPIDDYLEISFVEKGIEIKANKQLGETFLDLIDKTAFASSGRDETKMILSGILVEFKEGKLKLTATDGRRAAIVSKKVTVEGECRVVINANIMRHLQRLLVDEKLEKIVIGKKNVKFVLEQTTFNCNLLEEEYPNVDELVPKNNEIKVVVDVESFSTIMHRVAILSEEEGTYPITFIFRDGEVELEGRNKMISGGAKETLAIEYHGEEFKIRLNAVYVLPILKRIEKSAIFEFKDSNRPVLIKPLDQAKDKDYLCLVMPMQLLETE